MNQSSFINIKYISVALLLALSFIAPHSVSADTDLWWPASNAVLKGTQPFKALVQGKTIGEYSMYWKVDNGQLNSMYDSYNDYPHKEAIVDVSSWNWKGAGPYTLSFVSKDKGGNIIGEKSVNIFTSEPVVTNTSAPITSAMLVVVPKVSAPTSIAVTVPTVPVIVAPQVVQAPALVPALSASAIEVWWPTDNTVLNGVSSLMALVKGKDVSTYRMYWQVDNGNQNEMPSSYNNYPHKETKVDVTGWNWKGNGPYVLIFTAKDSNENIVATKNISIYVGSKPAVSPTVAPLSVTSASISASTVTTSIVLGDKLYVDPNNPAKKQATEWRSSRPNDATLMDKIANQSSAIWLGGWNTNVESDVAIKMKDAAAQNATPVFIAYNIPGRDCGSYSAGGANGGDAYKLWIRSVANGIGAGKAIVVLEPDALAGWDCLSSSDRDVRTALLSDAIAVLKTHTNTKVYLDAGHAKWIGADDMAGRLNKAGVSRADGFSLNVSNYLTTDETTTYGENISAKINKHFVIDTSRNGNGSNGEWCNPWGRALGQKPTLSTGKQNIDAYLWLKTPGESDGNCNGGPNAGAWWGDYALDLARNSKF